MGTPTQPNFNIDRAVRAALTDTPTKSKHGVTSPAILGGLKAGRQAVMKDIGEAIPQVSVQWFLDHILPPLRPNLSITTLVDALKNSQAIMNGHWADFQNTPSQIQGFEDAVFKPFANIARDVGKAAARALPQDVQTVVFKCNPNMVPHSKNRNNTSKPDGYGLHTKHHAYRRNGKVFWEFIVAPGEKKLARSVDAINDNNQKILWSMNHIMREDACRRFVVGYTIEDSHMRLWFCSRSDVFVTQSFDFRKKHDILVHFFASLMYATPEQLGFDPTIRPVPDPKGRAENQYEITLCDSEGGHRLFRTTRIISNIGAESIRGRGTRVWEAREIIQEQLQDDTVALKDCWIDDDREREAVILRKIVEAARKIKEETNDASILNILQNHLLTVVCYGDVYIDKAKDQTHTLLRRGAPIPDDLPPFVLEQSAPPKARDDVSQDRNPVGPDVDPLENKRVPEVIEYGIKSHHRIAFKQVGTTIDTLTSASDICEILIQTLRALQALHALGWVHRDISSGNVLIVDGVAKLTDFEYAKRMDDDSQHTLRTGTAYYMAIEVDDQKYKFFSRDTTEDELDEDELEARFQTRSSALKRPGVAQNAARTSQGKASAASKTDLPPFRHNPLHDSEGIWWLAVRLTLDRDIVINGAVTKEDVLRAIGQRKFYHNLFECVTKRREALLAERDFAQGQSYVHPDMLPFAIALERIRFKLVAAYTNAEKDVSKIDHRVAKRFCGMFFAELLDLGEIYGATDVKLQPLRPPPALKDTPEAPGATSPGFSLDSRQAPLKRRREAENPNSDIEALSIEARAEDPGHLDVSQPASKRMRQSTDDEGIAGPSSDEAEEAEVEEILGLSTDLGNGEAMASSAGIVRVGRANRKGNANRKVSQSPAGAETSTETTTGSRRSQRLIEKRSAQT